MLKMLGEGTAISDALKIASLADGVDPETARAFDACAGEAKEFEAIDSQNQNQNQNQKPGDESNIAWFKTTLPKLNLEPAIVGVLLDHASQDRTRLTETAKRIVSALSLHTGTRQQTASAPTTTPGSIPTPGSMPASVPMPRPPPTTMSASESWALYPRGILFSAIVSAQVLGVFQWMVWPPLANALNAVPKSAWTTVADIPWSLHWMAVGGAVLLALIADVQFARKRDLIVPFTAFSILLFVSNVGVAAIIALFLTRSGRRSATRTHHALMTPDRLLLWIAAAIEANVPNSTLAGMLMTSKDFASIPQGSRALIQSLQNHRFTSVAVHSWANTPKMPPVVRSLASLSLDEPPADAIARVAVAISRKHASWRWETPLRLTAFLLIATNTMLLCLRLYDGLVRLGGMV
ncbi:MAG: hypothetical protein H6729_16075 [Deltaproteobacteria bacterium]|nr:hypothetical protein [Deltaproteobacteria bacterium]